MGGASLQDLVAQCLSERHLGFALRLPRKAGDGRHGVGGFPSSVNLWNGSCADEAKAFGPAARTGNPVGPGDSGKFIAFAPIAAGANLGPGLRADRERRVSGECLGRLPDGAEDGRYRRCVQEPIERDRHRSRARGGTQVPNLHAATDSRRMHWVAAEAGFGVWRGPSGLLERVRGFGYFPGCRSAAPPAQGRARPGIDRLGKPLKNPVRPAACGWTAAWPKTR